VLRCCRRGREASDGRLQVLGGGRMTRKRAEGVDDYLGVATVSFVGRDASERARSRR
jgi:hypothetical protein